MSLPFRQLFWLLAWLIAAFGLLNLANLPGDFGESLCGPWG